MRIDRSVVFRTKTRAQLEPAKALDPEIGNRAKPILRVEIKGRAVGAVGEVEDERSNRGGGVGRTSEERKGVVSLRCRQREDGRDGIGVTQDQSIGAAIRKQKHRRSI